MLGKGESPPNSEISTLAAHPNDREADGQGVGKDLIIENLMIASTAAQLNSDEVSPHVVTAQKSTEQLTQLIYEWRVNKAMRCSMQCMKQNAMARSQVRVMTHIPN